MADVIVNHVSSSSPQFAGLSDQRGEGSPYAGMFLTYSRLFPDGAQRVGSARAAHDAPEPSVHDLRDRDRRTGAALDHLHERSDRHRRVASGRAAVPGRCLARFHAAGIKAIRLDAVGFAVKKAGTSCFMIPETFAFIADLAAQAHALRHGGPGGSPRALPGPDRRGSRQVDWVYDFALPPLVLHTLYTRNAVSAQAMARDSSRQRRDRPGHARRDRGAGRGRRSPAGTDRRPADGRRDRRAGRDDPSPQPRRESPRERQRGEQCRLLPDQLHVLRRARPQRLRVPDRTRHSVLRPGNSADLLRGPAGRQQRSRPAAPHRCGARHQPPLLHGGRTASRHWRARSFGRCWHCCGFGIPIRRSVAPFASSHRRPTRSARSGVEERRPRSRAST